MQIRASMPTIAVLLAALAVSLSAAAAQREPAQEPDHEAHEALRALRAVAEQAINENQLELLKPHLADEFSVVTYTDREFSDFDQFKARWQQTRDELLGEGGTYSTKLNPVLSTILGDVAIARGNSDNVMTTAGGTEYRFTARWSAVLHNVEGEWKIVRAHCSLSPFDNPMLKAAVTDMLIKAVAIAGGVGLLLGAVIGALLMRWRGKAKPRSP
jgi:ketosteroid isomerase-like protein